LSYHEMPSITLSFSSQESLLDSKLRFFFFLQVRLILTKLRNQLTSLAEQNE